MKSIFKSVLLMGALATLLLFPGCGPGNPPEPTVEEVQLGKLTTTWTISNVTLDNVSKISDYPQFQLTVTGTVGAPSFGYSTVGRPNVSPWPASGSWKFGTDPATQIVRDSGADELPMTYSVTDTQLQLTFSYSGNGFTARTSNVKGTWVFTFTR
ncbi:MAG: hypothetical protein ACOYXA_05350 [Bacteroidota bacterium]